MQQGNDTLAQPIQFICYRAKLTLEMDIVQAMQLLAGETPPSLRGNANWTFCVPPDAERGTRKLDDWDGFALHAETKLFIRWRSRDQLVRLRALLAIVCWHQGHWRWRRHWTAVIQALKKPAFSRLLTQRDPELGVLFWRIGLEVGVEVEWATAVLVEIGQVELLLPLLHHKKGTIRQQTADILAKIGDERARVGLTAVLAHEKQKPIRQIIQKSITHLENQPPPPLTIQLMGNFALWRGSQPIPATSWHRPIVLRLFQYFAINARRPLSKDKILDDDLWPDTDPAKAWRTFRTVYSRLRKLLEPHMRPKTANRYITLIGDTYTFDSNRQAEIDVIRFQHIISLALQNRKINQVLTIPEPLVEALQSYRSLLPDHPYAEWLLEPRQRIQELYGIV
ncbi:MAG: hypothetical protein GY805_02275 [Chloroflexi bacterium]|nr:hypothetical protein [Chloroflexota bacterium]